MIKECMACKEKKDITHFSFRKDTNKFRSTCISCDNQRKSIWKKGHRLNCNLSQQNYREQKKKEKIILKYGSIENYENELKQIEINKKKQIIPKLLMLFLQSKNLKKCVKCDCFKNINEFPITKNNNHRSTCKECNAQKTRIWVRQNKQFKKEMDKKYYIENIDRIKQYKQEWTKKHFSTDENKIKKHLLSKEHRFNHRELYRAYTIKRRELRNKIEDVKSINTSIVIDMFNGKCFKCGKNTRLSIDHHMPLSKGFKLSYSNAVVLCSNCNSSKNNKHPKEFYSKDELIKLNSMGIITYDNY